MYRAARRHLRRKARRSPANLSPRYPPLFSFLKNTSTGVANARANEFSLFCAFISQQTIGRKNLLSIWCHHVSLNQSSLSIKDGLFKNKFYITQELCITKISLWILHNNFNETLKFDAFRAAGETYRVTIIRSVDGLQREAILDDEDLLFSRIIKDLPSACDPLIRDRSQLIILYGEASLILLIGDCIISWRRRRQPPPFRIGIRTMVP